MNTGRGDYCNIDLLKALVGNELENIDHFNIQC